MSIIRTIRNALRKLFEGSAEGKCADCGTKAARVRNPALHASLLGRA